MRVYKVVRKFGEKFFSAVVEGKARVQYEIGEKAYPPPWLAKLEFHLLAFKTVEEARDFVKWSSSFVIFKAQAEERPVPQYCHILGLEQGRISKDPYFSFPEGIVGCAWIKLLEEVK